MGLHPLDLLHVGTAADVNRDVVKCFCKRLHDGATAASFTFGDARRG